MPLILQERGPAGHNRMHRTDEFKTKATERHEAYVRHVQRVMPAQLSGPPLDKGRVGRNQLKRQLRKVA